MEVWDAYDVQYNRLDRTLVRGEKIPQGLFHGVAIVIIQHEDGTFLLMKRDPNKADYPDYWEPGASGSILQGESFIQGAFREMKEETGLETDNMMYMGNYCYHEYHTLYKIYSTIYRGDKSKVTLQVHETVDYKWIEPNQLVKAFDEEWCLIMFPEHIETCIKNRELRNGKI